MANSIFSGIPGGNPSGNQNTVPTTGATPVPALGGQTNPLTPAFPAGSAAPSPQFTANTNGTDMNALVAALSNLNPGSANPGAFDASGQKAITGGFHKAGFPSPIGALLTQFLAGGAGFNPQVAAALIAALQPGIQRGEANIMEEFGARGLSSGSPAAIGLGDFESQAILDEGQILSQLYEQSVQNYMQVLLSGRESADKKGGVGSMLGGAGGLLSGVSDLIPTGGGAGAGASAAGGGGLATGVVDTTLV